MKLASTIARYLLGLMFTVFGLNGFLHFLHQPPPSSAAAMQYMTVMSQTHYFVLVFAIQLLCGVLFLVNRFVPLALVLLAPVLVNILMYHGLMDPGGIGAGVFVTILWFLVFAGVRHAFDGILQSRTNSLEA